ncbi:MAG: Adenylylsulfate kinase (EC [uncultured Sulfurovum sp.]|uniref:Adenylyl-sulfate kinase n=1 Tax=uncultured Sulfurovum sp. TaxID=269237 RepID=A0A6S6TRL2_9BACT|nr:MAG: Adenylylsulfate kinase (EC [uncultured Sulfurovum sp.]
MIDKNIVWHEHKLTTKERAFVKNQKPLLLWFTGLSASGKSTIANALELELYNLKKHTYLLDGDNIRLGLNKELTFSDEDRVENIRRIGEVGKLFVDAGLIVLSAFISPFRSDREIVSNLFEKDTFIEIFVDTPLALCEKRDPKGLYEKARKGEIANFTGIDSPYESPLSPSIHLKTDGESIEDNVRKVISYLEEKGYLSD